MKSDTGPGTEERLPKWSVSVTERELLFHVVPLQVPSTREGITSQ